MTSVVNLSRRDFLKTSSLLTGGLLLGVYLPGRHARSDPAGEGEAFAPNAFVRIASDDTVTVAIHKAEMGQGVYTALPMLVAEELDADWSKVRAEAAPVDPAYNHPDWGIQATGGSTSVSSSWQQLRTAGATARAMLVAAAAAAWDVDGASLRTENGAVINDANGERLTYGQLAETAAALEAPKDVSLKNPDAFKLIGKSILRLEGPGKVNGEAQFGSDVKLPGMLTAVIARPPVFGAKVKRFDRGAAAAVVGVKEIKQVDAGVAVIADSFWAAKTGRDLLQVEWEEGANASLSSAGLREQFAELAQQPGTPAKHQGDVEAAFQEAEKTLQAVYEFPYLAHAPMEPLNCTVQVHKDRCEIWTGTQFQTVDRGAAAQVLGIEPEAVTLHTTLLGGGFGRRAVTTSDFVVEAVQVAQGIDGPVKTMWTREDDIKGGYYRPFFLHSVKAALDKEGMPVAWSHRIVGQSILSDTPFEGVMVKDGIDVVSVEGVVDMPYAIPNQQVDLHSPKLGVPVLWWRSVGHTHTGLPVEGMLDELAQAAGKDPVQLRRALLADHPRHSGVLELAVEKVGWGTPLPEGRGRGIALRESFGSVVAEVAEVTMTEDGFKVDRIVCAVDCGLAVNPDNVKAQMESAIVFGLTAVVYGEITLKDGRVEQNNFNDYQLLRLNETPAIEVHIVASNDPPTGVGEPGTPPVAPAVANAIFAASGKRVRKLPIRFNELV